jgi:ABC-type sugar transport system ATPase subunit
VDRLDPQPSALKVRGVTKTYPGVVALRDVSLDIRQNEVHGLVGENGAGKSTLVKIITGALAPDCGELVLGDVRVSALTPRSASSLGISVIHQERQIAYDLSVAENVLLSRLPRGRLGAIDWRAARRQAEASLDQVGVDVDVRRPARELDVAALQALEIARALSANSRLIVMDEPTSALGPSDLDKVFARIRALREADVAVLFISHHLEEIFDVADVVTVLRDGDVVTTQPVADLDSERLVALVLGHDPERLARVTGGDAAAAGDVVIDVRDLHCPPNLRGVSCQVRAGEIVTVTGPVGSGQRELARCLGGIERPTDGRAQVRGKRLRGPRDSIRRGIVFVPADRKREGVLLERSVLDNLALGELTCQKSPLVLPHGRRRRASALARRFGVKLRSLDQPVRLLSGGNQQKVVIARWIGTGARVFVFEEPTAGIDVGTKIEIYRLLRRLADKGATIVAFSSDFEEIKLISDRVLILRHGRIAGELERHEITEERLLALEVEAG